MSIAAPDDNSGLSRRRQWGMAKAVPALDDLMLMLDEVRTVWQVSERAVRKAVHERRLIRVRRPGYQPYYPYSAVVNAFGEPKNLPPLESLLTELAAKGGNQKGFEFDEAVAA
jgi:hypothetical protein